MAMPLHAASAGGHETVVKLLLGREDLQTNLKDNLGRTPLLWAGAKGRDNVVKLLLAKKNVDHKTQDRYGQTPLLLAAGNGHEAIVKLLIAEGTDDLCSKDNFGRTPLSWAAKKGHSNLVKIICEKYSENGIVIGDREVEVETVPESGQESGIFCDVCLSNIPDADIYHHCGICFHGDFDVCQDCLLCGAHCLDNSHMLVKRTLQNGGIVESAD